MRGALLSSPAGRLKAVIALAVIAFLLLATMGIFMPPREAEAQPALSVSKSFSGKPLLGGTATVSVTVTNNGSQRGYNLSLSDVFSSSRSDPEGRVTFVSASESGGDLPPSSVSTDPATGDLTVSFNNFRDLEPTESTTINITVSLAGDATWEVGDLLIDDVTAQVNDLPDGSGTWRQETASASTEVIPITIVSKSANQSTGVGQATGTLDWPYTYTIDVQNNYVGSTENIVVTDTIPDGVEYLGVASGAAPDGVARDNATGITTLTWNVGTLGASAGWTVTYNAGIRYDYYGTDNLGTNRPHDDFDGDPPLGAPIADKTDFTNTAELDATWLGVPYSDSDTARVNGCYATIEKGVSPTLVGNGTVVTYTIDYYTSEYYNIDAITITDVLPDGQTYNIDASPAPDSVQDDTPGTGQTTLTWNALPEPMDSGTTRTITFTATVDFTWQAPPIAGEDIVADDSMSNDVTIDATWHDEPDPTRTSQTTSCASAAGVSTGLPSINKQVSLDGSAWTDAVQATVGDELYFRVRFNKGDGVGPIRSDIRFKDISVTDWLPPGTSYVAGSYGLAYSEPAAAFFLDPASQYDDPPTPVSIGGLNGLDWWLGNIERGGWWQVVFRVRVDDAAAVAEDIVVNDLGKLAGENTFGQRYSDRDGAEVSYVEPALVLTKTATSVPSPLQGGSFVDYRITVENTGSAAAQDVLVEDTLPEGMRAYDPTTGTISVELDGNPVPYAVSYNPGTGLLSFDLCQLPGINTAIPVGSVLSIDYTSQVESDVGAGASLTNTASVTWWTQTPDQPVRRGYGPVSDDETVTLEGLAVQTKELIDPPSGIVAIGDTATYRITVKVPPMVVAYTPQLQDVVGSDGLEYVLTTTQLSDVGGSPLVAARFTGGSTTADPSVDWAVPDPGCTLTWSMDPLIDNSTSAVDYVFQVEYQMRATGLVTPASQGGDPDDIDNWNWWPSTGGDPEADNTSPDRANISWNDSIADRTAYSNDVTTRVHQPYLYLDKSNDKPYPPGVKGGDTVNYTIEVINNGLSTSYNNYVVDTLPAGLLGTDPSASVAVELNSVTVPAVDYTVSWDGGTGKLVVDLGSPVDTRLAPGDVLEITYSATVDGDVGAGAALINDAYVEYNSRDDGSGRQVNNGRDPDDHNHDTSQVRTASATASKTIVGPNPVSIGDVVTYRIQVSVPAETVLYSSVYIRDFVYQDGLEPVMGGVSSLHDVSGNPQSPASFSAGADPTVSWGSPDPGATFRWNLNPIDNSGGPGVGDTDYVFYLEFQVRVTGLITPTSQGGDPADPLNWNWWWASGGDPTIVNAALDRGRIYWNDGTTNRNAWSPEQPTTSVLQPHLVLSKANSGSPVSGGSTVDFTLTAVNNGTSASFLNVLVDTLPAGMRGTDPSGALDAEVNGSDVPFTSAWDGGTGELIVNVTAPTSLAPGDTLEVTYTAAVDPDVGAGADLTNQAYVEYNSLGDGSGRHVEEGSDPTYGYNEADSTVTVPPATITKTCNAPGGEAAIGEPCQYTVDVTVPAHTSIYDATVTDALQDGLWLDSYTTLLNGVPTPVGSVTTTYDAGTGITDIDWDIGDFQNFTATGAVLSLVMDVRILPAYHDGTPVNGLPPSDAFSNIADLYWEDADAGGNPHTDSDTATDVDALEPHLVLSKENSDPFPPGYVLGGQAVDYTITVTNDGTSTAYQNVIVDTLPAGMRGADPFGSVEVRLNALLVPPGDYSVSWDGGTGELTVDLTAPAATDLAVGDTLEVTYTAVVDPGIGSGAELTNIASIEYDSWTNANGKHTALSLDPTDDNTDDSIVKVEEAMLTKTHDAPGDQATIGQAYDYTVSTTVPAYTVIYNSVLTDDIADGLEVDAVQTELDGVPTPIGSVSAVYDPGTGITAVTWDIGDYANNTASPLVLSLVVSVHVKDAYHDGTPVNGLPLGQDTFSNTADLQWEDEDTGGSTYTDSAFAPDVTAVEPQLTIAKSWQNLTHPGQQPEAGDTMLYTIQVNNTGTSAAYEVTVDDSVPADMTYDPGTITGPGADDTGAPDFTWDVGSIASGAGATLTFRAKVDGGVYWGTSLDNTAALNQYFSLPQPSTYPARPYGPDSDTAPATARAAGLVVDKQVTGDTWVQPGDTVSYRITVTNVGDAVAYGANVTDTIPWPGFAYTAGSTSATWSDGGSSTADPAGAPGPNLDWGLDALGAYINPGEQLVLDFEIVVQAGAPLGANTNTAYGFSDDGAGVPTYKASGIPADTDPLDADSAGINMLVVDKHLAPGQDQYVRVGDPVSYEITITNTGDTVIDVLPLQDVFDDTHLSFVDAVPSEDSVAANVIAWNDLTATFGDLAPGASIDVTVNFTATNLGLNVMDVATVSGAVDEHGDPVPLATDDDNTLGVTDPGITVTKTLDDPDGYVPVGGAFTYTIRVENTGDTVIVAPIEMLDLYEPDYLEFVSAVPAADPASGGGIVLWTDLTSGADLAPGAFVEVTVEFTALRPGASPDTDDLVMATADDIYGDPVAGGDLDTSLTVTDPRLSLEKSLASGQPGEIEVGDTATFLVIIENTGDTVMEVVPLRDAFEADKLEFVTASVPPDTQATGTLEWNDLTASQGDLAPGGSFELLLTFRALAVADETVDTAEVSGAVDEHGDSPPLVSDDAGVTILENTGGVIITKTSEPPNYSAVVPGQVVTYTIAYENTMEVPAENAVIQDYVDTTSEFVPGSLELNGSPLSDDHYDAATRLLTVPLGTIDAGAGGSIVFQVTVNEYDEARPEVTNVAQITTDQTGSVVSFPTIVLPVDPFEFHKAVQDLNGGDVLAGDILLWTITVGNIGSIPTTNVVVYDDVPANTTYVPGSITGQGADDSNPARMRWNVGSIDMGVTVTLTFQSRVNEGLPAGTEIRNQAILDADQLANPKLSAPEGTETAGPNVLPVTGADLYLFWLIAGSLILMGAALILLGFRLRKGDKAEA